MKRITNIPTLILAILLTLTLMMAGCARGAAPSTASGTPAAGTSTIAVSTASGASTTSGGTPSTVATAAVTAPAGKPDTGKSPVVFADPVFEKLLKAELKKETIYPVDLEPYTSMKIGGDHFLILAGKGIPERSIVLLFGTDVELEGKRFTGFGSMKSLADLVHFPNVTTLHVTLQPELDYKTIPDEFKKKLRNAHFTQSKIKDIGFLEGAKALFNLSLSLNEISDLSPLKGLSELVYLSGNSNKVSDLTPLSGLGKLKSLTFYENQIKDLTPLAALQNLETLELYANQVEDLTPLANIKSLKKLQLINNRIKDVSPLKGFASFDSLRLNGNPIKNIEVLDHIRNLVFEP